VIRTFEEEGRLTSTDVMLLNMLRTRSTGKNTIPRCDAGRNGKSQAVKFSRLARRDIGAGAKDIGGVLFQQARRLVSPNGGLVHRA